MKDKILFVSTHDKSLALYFENQILDMGGFITEKSLPVYFNSLRISKIGIYDDEDNQKINRVNEIQIPALEITHVLTQNYFTDILPSDLADVKSSALYMGVYDSASTEACLMGKIYEKHLKIQKEKSERYKKLSKNRNVDLICAMK